MTTQEATRYVRYTDGRETSYGILEGDTIRQLQGELLDSPSPTGRTARVSDVKLLVPIDPMRVSKVIGVTSQYHVPGQPPRIVPHPRWFAKLPSSLNPHEGEVELPPEAGNLNYEGEMVLVVGKKGRHITLEEAPSYIWGVTIGNDWSENTWFGERQRVDEPSRLISKSMDTWACIYHTIVVGLDYSNLDIKIRHNGPVVAEGNTSEMVNSPAELISYISRFVTLWPGDLIYSGTVPRKPVPMSAGDVCEVEIQDIGTLRNKIVAMGESNALSRPIKKADPLAAPAQPQRSALS